MAASEVMSVYIKIPYYTMRCLFYLFKLLDHCWEYYYLFVSNKKQKVLIKHLRYHLVTLLSNLFHEYRSEIEIVQVAKKPGNQPEIFFVRSSQSP